MVRLRGTGRRNCLTAAVVLMLVAGCADGAAVPSVPIVATIPPTSSTDPPSATTIPNPSSTTSTLIDPSLTFTASGQSLGSERSNQVSLGDLDDDGHLDVVLGNQGGVEIWFNDGGGRFPERTQEFEIETGWYVGLELGDLDGDDDLDALVVTAEGTGRTLINQGGAQGGVVGTLQDEGQLLSAPAAFCVSLGDLDGDGDLDAFVGREASDTVWFNDGSGTFVESSQALGQGITADVALSDLDGDGDLDALAGGWDAPAKVWLNDGTGILTDSGHDLTSALVHIHGLALGDLDGDGDLDTFLAISGRPNQVWLNDGAGVYSDDGQRLSGPPGHAVSLGDLDGDGDVDAFVANGTEIGEHNMIWLNDGSGGFTDSELRLGSRFSMGVALGDLDGDGDLDAVVANTSFGSQTVEAPNEVWFNENL